MMAPPNFNRLARIYRWMEWFSFGPWLMLCRCAFLNDCLASRRALALGEGDGRFTARLLRENPAILIDAVDASTAMLKGLSLRARPYLSRLEIYQADVRSWKPANPPYDLIVTHFFLDCLSTEEVKALASILSSAVSPGCFWIVSEFAVPEDQFGRPVARPVVWALYRAFRWLTGLEVRSLPDHHFALVRAGFSLERHQRFLNGLLVSEMWSAPRLES